MKKNTLILAFLITFGANSQITKKVLFLGNSYTYYNDLPSMVNNMATSTGDVLIYDSNTVGGYRFSDHAVNTTSLAKINSNTWDYVTLQGQSQETSKSESTMQTSVYPYVTTLCNAIRANNECSQPLFYMTWGRQNGDFNNCSNLPWVCTYEGMDDAIKTTYLYMADANDAEVTPVSAVWRYLRTNNSAMNLYNADESHPSVLGSYVAACAFYTMIYKKDPTFITWNSTISASDALTIKAAVKTIVYDLYATYDFTINPALSDFSEVINGSQVAFTNLSNTFDSVLWNFGNGITSTNENPLYTYPLTGTYTVSLTTTKCGKSHTFTKTINITTLAVSPFATQNLMVFPNPVLNKLRVQFQEKYKDIQIIIADASGRTIIKHNAHQLNIIDVDVSYLQSGSYTLSITADSIEHKFKILKI